MRKKEQGITLIALVITIIILIILATVSITLVFGEGGLIQRTQEGKQLTEQSQIDEQEELKGAEEYINGVLAGTDFPGEAEEKSEVAIAKDSGIPFESTTTIKDDLDNPVTIPGGFNIAEDSGTKVEEGIVIEDSENNQFVWIPVGEYNVTREVEQITEPDEQDGKLTNELTRRWWETTANTGQIPTPVSGDEAISESGGNYYYGEGSTQYTSVAKEQIGIFKTSANNNKGFYIGRYEQGEGNVCKSEVNPYINLTRDEAKNQAEAMYTENNYVTSELISSYAWDTTLNFICQTNEEKYLLATTTEYAYGNIGTNNKTQTGEYTADNYSNIYDFLGNCREWTTEYSNHSNSSTSYPCVVRGGRYDVSDYYAASRFYGFTTLNNEHISFRVQLYINPES